MGTYTLNDPLEFIGCEIGGPMQTLQVFKAPGKDAANPSNRAFLAGIGVAIGTSNPPAQYTELKVFNGSIKGSGLDSLIQDLKDHNLRVNRDGYQYVRVSGRRIPGTGTSLPANFMRLNDLFSWADYVDDPTSFDPNPSSTIWNRRDLSSNDKKVDYEKLETDLKQAIQDKKTAEADKVKGIQDAKDEAKRKYNDDLNKAKGEFERKLETAKKEHKDNLEKAKKEYERKLETAKKEHKDNLEKAKKEHERKLETAKKEHKENLEKAKKEYESELKIGNDKVKEMTEIMDRMKVNWEKAANVGARPLPPSAFYFSSIYKRKDKAQLELTVMGKYKNRISDPGFDFVRSIKPGSIVLYNAQDFAPHFWWVVQIDLPDAQVYGRKIAYDGGGRYPSPTDTLKFWNVDHSYASGALTLEGIGTMNCLVLQ